jgi:hypothetical protein
VATYFVIRANPATSAGLALYLAHTQPVLHWCSTIRHRDAITQRQCNMLDSPCAQNIHATAKQHRKTPLSPTKGCQNKGNWGPGTPKLRLATAGTAGDSTRQPGGFGNLQGSQRGTKGQSSTLMLFIILSGTEWQAGRFAMCVKRHMRMLVTA